MITLIQDTIDLWQEAERELDALPPLSPDHELVALIVADMRETYTRLTTAREWSATEVQSGRQHIESSRALLEAIHGRRPTRGEAVAPG